ncbi:MAG: SIMPL domain-containing protein [Vicinamibacterales bacterium]
MTMTTRTAVAFAALLFGLVAPVRAQGTEPEGPLAVTTGESTILATPDRAFVSLAAETRANNPRDAQRRNTEAMQPVLDDLRKAGFTGDALRTTGYDVEPQWDFVDGRRVSRGFVARNSLEVRIDDVERVGEVLGLVVRAGATTINGIRFDLRDRAGVEREALRQAVADARRRAEAAADGAGMQVARVLRIDEQGVAAPPMPMRAFAAREAASADMPPVVAGPIEVRASVTLTVLLR